MAERRCTGLFFRVQRRRCGRAYGTLSRIIRLPFRTGPDQVQVRRQDGILEIPLERLEADRPKDPDPRPLTRPLNGKGVSNSKPG